jgi:hypothetical protein
MIWQLDILILQRLSGRCQGQVPLPPIYAADPALDQPVLDQLPQHPVQRLLGDLQDVEKPGYRDPRPPPDEMDRAVMRPSQSALGEDRIGIAREVAIGKEQQLDPLAQLFIGQEQQLVRPGHTCARSGSGSLHGGFPMCCPVTNYVSLVD